MSYDPTQPMEYLIVIERGNDGSLSAYVPDLPGCTSCGDTLDELRSNIREAVALHVESLRTHGEPVPAPSAKAETVIAA